MEQEQNYSANNKRVAKNTLVLYIRMLVMMGIGFFTSRVVLEALGVENFGIYNAVGGMVSMFTVISGSISHAISRFLTVELGKGNQERLKTIFSTSVIIQLVLSIIIVLLIESVGLWFLTNKMVIPPDRIPAAIWVLHCSSASLVLGLLSTPYGAAIVAHEKMSAFAYIGILDVVWKLLIAYLIMVSPIDTLVFYAILNLVVSIIMQAINGIYCSYRFEECRKLRFVMDKGLFREMFNFAGWSFMGSSAYLLKGQGLNLVLNLFYGPVANAAWGVAFQVTGMIKRFNDGFSTALNPQITKTYASKQYDSTLSLMVRGTKFSCFLMLILGLPVILELEYLLNLWLVDVPQYTVMLTKLVVVNAILESCVVYIGSVVHASGNIKWYHIIVAGLLLFNLPVSYVCLKFGLNIYSVMVVSILLTIVSLVARVILIKNYMPISRRAFSLEAIIAPLSIGAVSFVVAYLVQQAVVVRYSQLVTFLITCTTCTVILLGLIITLGLNKNEKNAIVAMLRSKFA